MLYIISSICVSAILILIIIHSASTIPFLGPREPPVGHHRSAAMRRARRSSIGRGRGAPSAVPQTTARHQGKGVSTTPVAVCWTAGLA